MAATPFVNAAYSSGALSSAAFPAGALTGANFVVCNNTANGPGTLTTRTALQMLQDGAPGMAPAEPYVVRIIHAGTGTMTIGAGSGVTITGTATIATVCWREFLVTFTGWPGTEGSTGSVTCTMQSLGSGAV